MKTRKKTPASRESCCGELRNLLSPAFFRALCDPTRLEIVTLLAVNPSAATVSEIAACSPVDISVVSRHLATLKGAGILDSERNGKEVRYGMSTTRVARFLRDLADALERCCPGDREDQQASATGRPGGKDEGNERS